MRTLVLILIALVAIAALLFGASLPGCTGTTVTGCIFTRSGWPQAYGGPYDVYLQPTPTSLTVVDAATSHVLGACVENTTGAPLTFTFQSGDTSPVPIPPNGSILANTQVCSNTPWGLLVNKGFSVSGPAGLDYSVSWTH